MRLRLNLFTWSIFSSAAAAFTLGRKAAVAKHVNVGSFRNIISSASSISRFSSTKNDVDITPFETWTFDTPTKNMECNKLSNASLFISSDIDSNVEDADLVFLGIFAPPSIDKDDDERDQEGSKISEPAVLNGLAKVIDDKFGGIIKDVMNENYKMFKNGASAGEIIPTIRLVSPGVKAQRYILIGLGNESDKIEDDFSAKLGKILASKINDEKKVSKVSVVLPSKFVKDEGSVYDLATNFYSTIYSDNRYRTGDNVVKFAEELKSISIVSEDISELSSANAAIENGKSLASGVLLAKDIVNAPHNVLNSESLANVARQIAEESNGLMSCTILGKKECEERGMGAYLGVARGSETEPQFIHLVYTPKNSDSDCKKVGIVGKGLLFDTGGYNIKTSMMELMKFDCGGAAAVLGAAKAIVGLAPDNVEAHFIVAACENMINEKAFVPSDILTASNGITIEVKNTDAEGRLTLADALVFADKELQCDSIIELSTLTGAVMISLGKGVCGIWTSDDNLANELNNASKLTGDKSWRMPMEKSYNAQLESKIADISNLGTPYGGAITAALFLQNFVDKKKPFAHIDIAGPVWDDNTGATGFGTKLASEWIVKQGKRKND